MKVKYTDNSKKVLADIERGVIRGILQGGELLATNIQKQTPVVTGNLKQSIKPTGKVEQTLQGYSTEVNTPVKYAAYVEYGGGTRKTKNGSTTITFTPRAMFRKGAKMSEGKIEKIIQNNLQ